MRLAVAVLALSLLGCAAHKPPCLTPADAKIVRAAGETRLPECQ